MKEEGTPFKIVLESNFVTTKVIIMPNKINAVSKTEEAIEGKSPPAVPIKNIVIIAINVGNAPPNKRKV